MFAEATKRSSAIVLIVANLLPLVGVVFWGWSVFNIVVLYWLENVVLGGINILKMITCKPTMDGSVVERLASKAGADLGDGAIQEKLAEVGTAKQLEWGHSALKLFMIPFFTVHYFGFCAGHGLFVFVMFDGGISGGLGAAFERIPGLLVGGLGLAALGLVVSHLYSFFSNYIGRGEYKRTVVPLLMFQPYGRIILLHVAIIFGGFAVMALGSPVILLVILVVGKIVIDLKMHLREHAKAMVAKIGSPLLDALSGGRS